MNVAFCVAEMYPFAKTGGLADVAGALPIALEKLDVNVDVFMPYYGSIPEEVFDIKKIAENVYKTTVGKGVTVYLLENKQYFNREGLYGDIDGDFKDNFERFYWFDETVLEFIKNNKVIYDVIHCHDWHSALIPVLLKEKYNDEVFQNTSTVFTIHNLAYQGVFDKKYRPNLNLAESTKNTDAFDFYNQLNWLKAGLVYADRITTVSQQYAQEITTKEFGCGLEETLQALEEDVIGIVNGLDYDVWNPQNDPLVAFGYSTKNFKEAKKKNKADLQKRMGLPIDSDVPLLGFVGRIAHQKGFDLILDSVHELAKLNIQWVIQGVGDEGYYEGLHKMQELYPRQCAICLDFDEPLAHQIYSGSDFFFIPSRFEPCGLSQLISFRYGTLPVAFATGGLIDTITPYDQPNGNGFLFREYSQKSLIAALQKALDVYVQPKQMNQLIKQAMKADFSWGNSAKKYKELYTCLQSD